jgi:hypothetical protein
MNAADSLYHLSATQLNCRFGSHLRDEIRIAIAVFELQIVMGASVALCH